VLAELRRDAARLRLSYPGSTARAVVEALLFNNGFQAVVLHRIAHGFRSRRIPVLGPLVARLNLFLTGVDVNPTARIAGGLLIAHGHGLVIGGGATIGADALILHGVTVGSPSPGRVGEMPVIGDRVFLGAGSKVVGAVTIGDDVVVGPNTVILEDVPAGSRVMSAAGVSVTPRGPAGPPKSA
jgi:serine O-acetyltransferase